MFIETPEQMHELLKLMRMHTSIINLYYTHPTRHPSLNDVLGVFIYVNKHTYVISIRHPDAIHISDKILDVIYASPGRKIIFDRKRIKYFVKEIKNGIDAKVCSYLNFKESIDTEFNITQKNDLRSVPIMILLKHFKNMCLVLKNFSFSSGSILFESDFSNALYEIEKNGLFVRNFNLGSDELVNSDNLVYSQYNMLTPTGRPSNAFGNVNFAALNKKTGQRDCFVSRFLDDGLLVMVDYESYHLRLLANFLEYDLPKSSLHEYLGRLYHGKDKLTEEEYEISKKITFNLIYGGITDDVKMNVPFMKKIADYVDSVWDFYCTNHYVETWYYKRRISDVFFKKNVNSYKIFNYLLQSAETEKNCKIISELNNHFRNMRSKIILYTYDAFLFDVHKTEFEVMKSLIDVITSDGQYPIRMYSGKSYGSMKQINF